MTFLGDISETLGVSGIPTLLDRQPGAGFDVWVYDRADPNGAPLGRVPTIQTLTFEDALNDVGSGQITVATEDADPAWFVEDHIWRVVWERHEFGYIAEMVTDVTVAANGSHVRTVAGRGIGQRLAEGLIYPGDWPGPAPVMQRLVTGLSRAQAMLSLLAEAQGRGAVPYFAADGWDGAHDSFGTAWADLDEMQLAAGTTLLKTLTDFGTAAFDWHVDSRFGIQLYAHGLDRTRQILLSPGGDILVQSSMSDRRQLANVVLVQDGNYGVSEVIDAPSVTGWGRREQFASASQAVTDASRVASGQALLALWKDQQIQRNVQVSTVLPGRKPFIDYGVGDIIGVEFPDIGILQSRVVAIAMSAGTSHPECELTLDFMLEHRDRTAGVYVPPAGGTNPVPPTVPGGGFKPPPKTKLPTPGPTFPPAFGGVPPVVPPGSGPQDITFRCAASGGLVLGAGAEDISNLWGMANSLFSDGGGVTSGYTNSHCLRIDLPAGAIAAGDVVIAFTYDDAGGAGRYPPQLSKNPTSSVDFVSIASGTLTNVRWQAWVRIANADDEAGCSYVLPPYGSGYHYGMSIGVWSGVNPALTTVVAAHGNNADPVVAPTWGVVTPTTNCVAVAAFQVNCRSGATGSPNVGDVVAQYDSTGGTYGLLMSENKVAATGVSTPTVTIVPALPAVPDTEAWTAATILLVPATAPNGVQVTVPTAVRAGDLLLAFVTVKGDAGYSITTNPLWSLVRGPDKSLDTNPVQEYCFSKIAVPSDAGKLYSFEVLGATVTSAIADLVVYYNVDPITPINVSAFSTSQPMTISPNSNESADSALGAGGAGPTTRALLPFAYYNTHTNPTPITGAMTPKVGDVVVASIVLGDDSTTITPPAGWTLIDEFSCFGSKPIHMAVYWHVLEAGDETPIDMPEYFFGYGGDTRAAGAVFALSASTWWASSWYAWSGVDPTAPIVAHSSYLTTVDLASGDVPTLTTTKDGQIVVVLTVNSGVNDSWTITNPNLSGATALPGGFLCQGSSIPLGQGGNAYQMAVAGAIGPSTVSWYNVFSPLVPAPNTWGAMAIVLNASGLTSRQPTAPPVTTTLPGCMIVEGFSARVVPGPEFFTAGPATNRLTTNRKGELAALSAEQYQTSAGLTVLEPASLSTPAQWVAQTVALQPKYPH